MAKENRINTFFSQQKPLETELWAYLNEFEVRARADQLKRLAALGLILQKSTGIESPIDLATYLSQLNTQKRGRRTNKLSPVDSQETKLVTPKKTSNTAHAHPKNEPFINPIEQQTEEGDDLFGNISLTITAPDPEILDDKVFGGIVGEEDDEEILSLLKNNSGNSNTGEEENKS